MKHENTKPNTPFGHLLVWMHIWHPSVIDTIADAFSKLNHGDKYLIEKASGVFAIINQFKDLAPDELFLLIQKKFPEFTRENLQDILNKILATMSTVENLTAGTVEECLTNISKYLAQFEGDRWVVEVRKAVEMFISFMREEADDSTTILHKALTFLEFVYQDIIKGGWLLKLTA